jgi:NAD(P)-dependent dehydrogenase (short-subunit alcohol dehydrogenase family)
VVATSREPQAAQRLAELRAHHGDALLVVPLDVRDERTIAAAAAHVADACGPELHWVVNCAGLLHDGASLRPERSIEQVDAQGLHTLFAVNAFGPLLVAKHLLPLLTHEERAVLANLSARVGSIADNRLGGWYGYRAAKTAQNMFTRAALPGERAGGPSLRPPASCPAAAAGDRCLHPPGQRSLPVLGWKHHSLVERMEPAEHRPRHVSSDGCAS